MTDQTPVETAAAALCTADSSYWHHEQTDDFPCTWCRTRASAFGDSLAEHRDDIARALFWRQMNPADDAVGERLWANIAKRTGSDSEWHRDADAVLAFLTGGAR